MFDTFIFIERFLMRYVGKLDKLIVKQKNEWAERAQSKFKFDGFYFTFHLSEIGHLKWFSIPKENSTKLSVAKLTPEVISKVFLSIAIGDDFNGFLHFERIISKTTAWNSFEFKQQIEFTMKLRFYIVVMLVKPSEW